MKVLIRQATLVTCLALEKENKIAEMIGKILLFWEKEGQIEECATLYKRAALVTTHL